MSPLTNVLLFNDTVPDSDLSLLFMRGFELGAVT